MPESYEFGRFLVFWAKPIFVISGQVSSFMASEQKDLKGYSLKQRVSRESDYFRRYCVNYALFLGYLVNPALGGSVYPVESV